MSSVHDLRDRISTHRMKTESRHLPPELREEVVKAFGASKLSQPAFAKILDVSISSISNWSKDSAIPASQFQKVQIIENQTLQGLTVYGPGWIRIEGLDVLNLAMLIRVLGGQSC
jgi:DNA-binding transcriptional regulator YiaG